MSRRRQIYEGKAKILYEGPEPGTLIQYFKDDATAFNAQKKGTISGKGVLNNRISEHVFTLLGQIGVPHHFVRRLNMREQLIRQVEIVPIEVVVRNVAAGSLSKRLGIEEGTQLPRTLIEYCYKDDALGDPLVAEDHIACFGWASQDELHDIQDMAIRINDFMCGLFAGIGIRLVDFKLEFGRLWDGDFARISLADEISPDGCRLWDMASGEKLDKDRFRRDLGGEVEAYQEVARRLGLLPEGSDGAVLDLDTHRRNKKGQYCSNVRAGRPLPAAAHRSRSPSRLSCARSRGWRKGPARRPLRRRSRHCRTRRMRRQRRGTMPPATSASIRRFGSASCPTG